MTSWDSYVDDAPPIDPGHQFDQWLDGTPAVAKFERGGQPLVEDGALELSRRLDREYPRRLELSVDSRRAQLLDWLFSRRVRRGALTITTVAVVACATWLLATEFLSSSEPGVDFADFAAMDESVIQSVSADTAAALGQASTPMLSSDGRIQLRVTQAETGWVATVEQPRDTGVDGIEVAAIRMLVNGVVVGEAADLPRVFDIAAERADTDVATLILSAVVDWSNETSSPVSVAVANLG